MKVPTTPTPLEGEVLPKVVGMGDRLKNGAIVLAVKPYTPAMGNTGVVFLALSHRDFVTWVGYPDGSETYWGHYFGVNLTGALADFQART